MEEHDAERIELVLPEKERLTVVLPAYRESLRIGQVLEEIRAFIKKYPRLIQQVIVVDDGSTDNTAEVVMRFTERMPLRLTRYMENKGKWHAVIVGIGQIKSGPILLMDADGSASIWVLEWTGIPMRGVAFMGSRFHEAARVEGKSLLRSIVSQGYRAYVKFIYALYGGTEKIQDFQCPYKIFWKEDVVKKIYAERFAGDVGLMLALDAIVVNVPVTFIHKQGSKVPASAVWRMFWETMEVARETSRGARCK